MFGREEQLRALEEGLAEAAAGRPRIALVTGEAGVGKTRLLQALEAEARSRGFLVLHGESVEFGGEELPYAPITAALRGLPEDWTVPADAREPLDVLLPDPVPAAPAPAGARPGGAFGQARLYEVLLGLLARLATERAPVLVALEDLHWADRSTRNLLPFLARNLRAERIAVAVTYRTEELLADNPLRPLVAELIRRPAVTGIELEPLAPADAARQLEMIAGRPLPASLVADLHARTGGNPFFLEELFAAQEGGERSARASPRPCCCAPGGSTRRPCGSCGSSPRPAAGSASTSWTSSFRSPSCRAPCAPDSRRGSWCGRPTTGGSASATP